ncbi:unnamed protein product [Moneuplotes crassus]|uniref:Uncharacterized protein n=1 Tax=Euplotes crassus TaxID=5936 RepID=A0AAD1TZB0_EUPCR|nr:unnamed protein product [Moneuplotes crassus]
MEACNKLGYTLEELKFKTKHELKIKMGDLQVTKEVLDIRWNAYEDNRKNKINKVMDERRKIIEKNEEYISSAALLTSIDRNSPQRLKDIKLHNSVLYQDIENMIEEDEEIRKQKLEIEKIKQDHQKELEKYLKQEINNEFSMDTVNKSAQEFAKENLLKKKQKEIEEIKMHAQIKRQQFEEREKKAKEKEMQDKMEQMDRLEEERKGLQQDYDLQEQKMKESHKKLMDRMKRDNMTKQQIDQFRAEQKNKMEERRSVFDRKVIYFLTSLQLSNIEDRIQNVHRSRERIVQSIKQDHDQRMTKTQEKFHNNLRSFQNNISVKYNKKVERAQEQLAKLENIKEEEIHKRKKISYHNKEKVKQKHDELMAMRLRELKRKNRQTEQHFLSSQNKRKQELEEKRKEAELREKHREEVRSRVNQEFQEKLHKTSVKLEKIDEKAERVKREKEKERLLAIELEAIRRREREEEAKRILRAEEYKRNQDANEKEKQHIKATYLMSKRKEVKELRKTVRQNALLYKEKVKQEVSKLKKKRKLSPDRIHINVDPYSTDKMYISHDTSKSSSQPDINSIKRKGRKFAPSGSYVSSDKDQERGN